MGLRRKSGFLDVRRFAKGLCDLTNALPTNEEKAILRKQFDEIMTFLDQTRNALDSLPSGEDMESVRRTARVLEELSSKGDANPFVAAATGRRISRAPLPKPMPLTEQENEGAQALLKELNSLSADEMSMRLQSEERTSTRELNAAARILGIKTTRRTTREALVQQVVTKVSNFRGYQELQGK